MIAKLEEIFFPSYISYNKIYKHLCKSHIKDRLLVLHLGAGRDKLKVLDICRGNSKLISLDIDFQELICNSNKSKIAGNAYHLPFKNKTFDLILSEAFFEHIKDPEIILSECFRVSKIGSRLIFTTPNKFSYISLFNTYMPKFIKDIAKKMRGLEIRYFPTYYAFNTYKNIEYIARDTGYNIVSIHSYIGPPGYFNFSIILWCFFAIIHKIIENIKFLSNKFYMNLVGILRHR